MSYSMPMSSDSAADSPKKALFDDWPERYETWFSTPLGEQVRRVEGALILEMLDPAPGERILDVGCGTGIFTMDYLSAGAEVVGLDISAPMLTLAERKAAALPFTPVLGDMLDLPFVDACFDKVVSVTALEFVTEGRRAVAEMFRVTRPGGLIVVGTLNRLSPWAERRLAKTARGEAHVLQTAVFRSPEEVLSLARTKGTAKTVVHFQKDDLEDLEEIERMGQARGLETGAFVAARWLKPR